MADTEKFYATLISELSDGAAAHSTNRQLIRNLLKSVHLYPTLAGETGVVSERYPYGDVRRFGAVDGAADSSPGIQAAIAAAIALGSMEVLVPSGTWKLLTSINLTGATGLRIRGTSSESALIRSATVDLFTWTGSCSHVTMERLRLWSQVGGGHIWTPTGTGACSGWVLKRLQVFQDNQAKSYWSQLNSTNYIDMKVKDSFFTGKATNNHTVPLWNLLSDGGVNSNTWERCRFTYSGAYVFQIDDASAASFAYGNVWRDLTFEVTNGGNIALYNCAGVSIENCDTYDLGTTTADLYKFARSPTTSAGITKMLEVRNCMRIGGTLGGGFYDIAFGSSSATTMTARFIRCTNVGGSTFAINLNSKKATLVHCSGAVISNRPAAAVVETELGLREVITTELSPAQITAQQNDYDPGYGGHVLISSDAAGRIITGIANGAAGIEKTFTNIGAFTIPFSNQSASSIAANRITFPEATGRFPLLPGASITFKYDATTGCWRPKGASAFHAPPLADPGDTSWTFTPTAPSQLIPLDTPLTGVRTVTLTTTGVADGTQARFSRGAAATGASGWAIGALKTLAVSQWVDIEMKTGAWRVSASGTV